MNAHDGYQRLVQAAHSLQGTELLELDREPTAREVADFLAANRPVLDAARDALRQRCSVPVEYTQAFWKRHCDDMPALVALGRGLAVELDDAWCRDDFADAIETGLDILDLGYATRRGGLITDFLTSLIIESIAINRLRQLRRQLPSVEAIRLSSALLHAESQREALDEIASRDAHWEEVAGVDDDVDFMTMPLNLDEKLALDPEDELTLRRMICAMAELPDEEIRKVQRELDERNLASLRMLALESAQRAHRQSRGEYVHDLDQLMPEFIPRIPVDPFTGRPFRLRLDPSPPIVYSPGPSGNDLGGTCGPWIAVLGGQADLCLDYFDHQGCRAVPPRRFGTLGRVRSWFGGWLRKPAV